MLQKFAEISKEITALFFYHENASTDSPGVPVYSTTLYRRHIPDESNVYCTALIGPDLVSPFSEISAMMITFFCCVGRYIQAES
jgi:hypothetical protein